MQEACLARSFVSVARTMRSRRGMPTDVVPRRQLARWMMNDNTVSRTVFDLFELPMRAIAHGVLHAIVLIDDEQNIVGINPQAQRMFGCARIDELDGMPLACLVPERYRASHAGLVAEFIESGETERHTSSKRPIHGLRVDGSEFPAEATVSRVNMKMPGGSRRYFVMLLRDLSQEAEDDSGLENLQQRLKSILDLSPVAMWIIEDDKVAYANRPAVELFGLSSRSQLKGRSIYELLNTDSHEGLRGQMLLAMGGNTAIPRVNCVVSRPDGSVREVEVGSAVLSDDGQPIIQMVLMDISQRHAENLELERSKTELRRLSANVVEAREAERKHIARELHDELGQRLTALKMEVAGLRSSSGAQKISPERVGDMLEMIDETVAALRRIAADLRPLMLDDLGLNAALEWLARDVARRMDMEVSVKLCCEDPDLGDSANIAIYRIIQEALTNAARHAHATDVQIEMHRLDDELVLTIQDNGIGFPDDALKRIDKYGLMGIRERAYMLGGRLEIDNPLGGGGRLTAHLPLRAAGEACANVFRRRSTDA